LQEQAFSLGEQKLQTTVSVMTQHVLVSRTESDLKKDPNAKQHNTF